MLGARWRFLLYVLILLVVMDLVLDISNVLLIKLRKS